MMPQTESSTSIQRKVGQSSNPEDTLIFHTDATNNTTTSAASDDPQQHVSSSSQRLDFNAIQPVARPQELHRLLQYVNQQQLEQQKHNADDPTRDSTFPQQPSTSTTPALVLIESEAGVGKSVLLHQFAKTVQQQYAGCLVLRGKFEERAAASEAFAAIRECLNGLLNADWLVQDQSLQAALRAYLRTEQELLLSVLPSLAPLFGQHDATQHDATLSENANASIGANNSTTNKVLDDSVDAFGDFSHKEYRFERFRFAVRNLLRFVGHQLQGNPLILLLDDLHWIDPDSLHVLKTLMDDRRSTLLVIAATRPIESVKLLYDLRNSYSPRDLSVMGVSRLSITEVSNMLSQLLQRNDVQTLARIVKSKTHGNFFVVLQFLRLLEKLHFLYFENDAWHFDTTAISSVQLISEDVQQLVAQNLETLATDRKAALMVAASFGVSKFEVSTIVHAIRALDDESKHGDDSDILFEDPHIVREKVNTMSVELTKAAGDGFVEETTTPGQFRFSHDRIRESAYSLLPKGESRKGVHLRVGRQLRSWMDTQSELGISQGFSRESLLLHATKQLNAGSDLIDDMWEVLDLAELNYQSAELAASKTAFFSSMEYLRIGLAHLGDNGWKEHYALALKFSVALARIQYSCNMLQECWQTTSIVIDNGKTFRDKEQAFHTQMLVHMQNERLDEALKLALSVCDQIGHPFPRRFKIGTIMMQFFQVRKAFRALSDQELLELPALEDKDVDMHIDFLEHLGEISMLDNQFVYIFLYTMRTLLIVLKQGHYARSFNTLMSWAFIKV